MYKMQVLLNHFWNIIRSARSLIVCRFHDIFYHILGLYSRRLDSNGHKLWRGVRVIYSIESPPME